MSAASSAARNKPSTSTALVLAFASLYFFWGSTYTAIRIGGTEMPSFLFGAARFLIAGGAMLALCAARGLRLWWPPRAMAQAALVGVLLLSCSNVSLIYAEKTLPSGLASLISACIPLLIALAEMVLPHGEPLPRRGWLGMGLGFVGLAILLLPSLRQGFGADTARLAAIAVLLFGCASWVAGTLVGRRARLEMNSFVGAGWQMLAAGVVNLILGSALGEWPEFRPTSRGWGAVAYLVVCGSLLGYSSFVYLIERMPVAKVASYAYVNPVVAVLLGVVILGERPDAAELAGMIAILLAVFLITTARVGARTVSRPEVSAGTRE